MFWVNGVPQSHVSLDDRSFQYGDGCFTTILTKEGELLYWQAHVERLDACLKALMIPSPDWSLVLEWANQAAMADEYAGVKIHVSRGHGGRGYSPAGIDKPTVTISNFSYPSHYPAWRKQGVDLGLCETRLGIQPLLAGHKHNNRLEQVLAKAELENTEFADAVTLNVQNHVIETTMANLFWVKDHKVFTPELTMSGVAGVMRRKVLELLATEKTYVNIGNYLLEDLLDADEAFMCNSLLGIAPIRSITISNKKMLFPQGKLTQRLQGNLTK
ncbi:aminodeoxychorismate lyase [Vibrio mytili]